MLLEYMDRYIYISCWLWTSSKYVCNSALTFEIVAVITWCIRLLEWIIWHDRKLHTHHILFKYTTMATTHGSGLILMLLECMEWYRSCWLWTSRKYVCNYALTFEFVAVITWCRRLREWIIYMHGTIANCTPAHVLYIYSNIPQWRQHTALRIDVVGIYRGTNRAGFWRAACTFAIVRLRLKS